MTRQPTIWFAGLFGSVLAHFGFAAVLLWSLQPDPLEQQPSPQSELQMQSYRVPHSQAVPQVAKSDPAAQSEARGEELTAGAVPQSTAQSIAPKGSQLVQTVPDSIALTAKQDPPPQAKTLETRVNVMPPLPIPSPQLAAATAPVPVAAKPAALVVSQTTEATPPAPVMLAAASVQPSTAATLTPVARPVGPAAVASTPTLQLPSDAQPLALTQPDSKPSSQQEPEPTALAEHPLAPVKAALSAPEVPHIKAALAFSGAGADQADPVSLAAFQSFMRPGDIATTEETLRDGVAGILAAVPCSRLQVLFDPETASLALRGHLPEPGLRAPVLAALQAQMGADIHVSDQMKLLPRPQCGALAGISNVGLPQSTDQITNPLLIGTDTHARVLEYAGGDRMFFDLTAPDYDAYVYVDYFDAGGAVLHLTPNASVPLSLTPAQSRLRVGAKTAADIGLQITVGPPYGQEIAVAFAASHPLYPGVRPLSEEAADYLSWLSQRVTEARATYPGFKGEWVYFFVTTAAQ
ncbi:MAG: DUF4384 domain-containing protein [Rhodobacteraceae bacterium]|nr:DUF4384 domain-containing protein [Paracoccaceae bacterium]